MAKTIKESERQHIPSLSCAIATAGKPMLLFFSASFLPLFRLHLHLFISFVAPPLLPLILPSFASSFPMVSLCSTLCSSSSATPLCPRLSHPSTLFCSTRLIFYFVAVLRFYALLAYFLLTLCLCCSSK